MDASRDPQQPRLDPVTEILLAEGCPAGASSVAVLDDAGGALTGELGDVDHLRVWCDDLRDQVAVPVALRADSPAEAVRGAELVLWRLPKSLGALEEYAQLIAAYASPGVRVVAAGREKHLNRSMNEVLARSFGSVTASLGRRKARALVAGDPKPGPLTWPRTARLDAYDLDVVAHGATFSTNRLDRGTRLLLSCLDDLPQTTTALDLGSGSGIIAALLTRQGRVTSAVDVTWSGASATALTAAANGLDVDVHLRDGLDGWTDPVELVVTNPPFHVGTAKDSEPTRVLFADAGRWLAPGGELWCVFNAHLPYLGWLRDAVGPAQVVARDREYVVVRSRRDGDAPGHRSAAAF